MFFFLMLFFFYPHPISSGSSAETAVIFLTPSVSWCSLLVVFLNDCSFHKTKGKKISLPVMVFFSGIIHKCILTKGVFILVTKDWSPLWCPLQEHSNLWLTNVAWDRTYPLPFLYHCHLQSIPFRCRDLCGKDW